MSNYMHKHRILYAVPMRSHALNASHSSATNMRVKIISLILTAIGLSLTQVTLAAKYPKCKNQTDPLDHYASIFEQNEDSSKVKRGQVSKYLVMLIVPSIIIYFTNAAYQTIVLPIIICSY